MIYTNCYVIVKCDDDPVFGRFYVTLENVWREYSRFPSFTGKMYLSLKSAKKVADKLNDKLSVGDSCYIVCGCYCKDLMFVHR